MYSKAGVKWYWLAKHSLTMFRGTRSEGGQGIRRMTRKCVECISGEHSVCVKELLVDASEGACIAE